LAELLGLENSTENPMAEYWLGTHPGGMAHLTETEVDLATHLKKDLPFLFKILDVRDMLSIQMHPSLEEAKAGFAREEAEGLYPRDHRERVFRDANHKPELMVALSDFYLVQGFKSNPEIEKSLAEHPEFSPLLDIFQKEGLKALFTQWMGADQDFVNQILKPLGKRIKPLYKSGSLTKDDINFWSARAYFTFNRKGICDRGIFVLYLMNLVQLKPGQAVFQSPGQLHAYLEGQNAECMATSDNVVRGGLTQKAIRIDALLAMVKLEHTEPTIYQPNVDRMGFSYYSSPKAFDDFVLSVFQGHQTSLAPDTDQILFCAAGCFQLNSGSKQSIIAAGGAVLIAKNDRVAIMQHSKNGILFIAQSGK